MCRGKLTNKCTISLKAYYSLSSITCRPNISLRVNCNTKDVRNFSSPNFSNKIKVLIEFSNIITKANIYASIMVRSNSSDCFKRLFVAYAFNRFDKLTSRSKNINFTYIVEVCPACYPDIPF